ncbi:protein ENHANCED DISEASE RESISTANCE 4-like isoform X2 [Mangifera indica]|uniref:protein ENHANCED DISEASE RESISTANCE 4-like isoform X2 n=1 Tax=Mangifera indica TaxID=29780 RepID=UPI001CF939AA|nr:protein ENHANCED DISEASE RESISTANCE 4-like isoform X2 [Mangifera indica]
MESQSEIHKFRFVRCPRCRQLLPEPANVLVYQCGGCSTFLQVKHRNIDSKSASSGSCGIDAAKRDELHHDSSESVSSSLKETLLSTGESSLNQNNGDQNISTDCNIEKFVGVNSSDKDRNNENDHLESPDCDIKTAEVSNEFCSSTAHAFHQSEELPLLTEPNSEVEVHNGNSLSEEEKTKFDIDNESGSSLTRLNTDNTMVRMNINSTVTSYRTAGESISSDIFISSPDEHQEQLHMSGNDSYSHLRSTAAFETTILSSELSCNLECLSKSPKNRGSHAYDGSVSSYDGIDDQVPNQQMDRYKNAFSAPNSCASEEGSRTDKFLTDSSSVLQLQGRNFTQDISNKRHCPLNGRKWNGDELLESTTHGYTVGNRIRRERDELLSSMPYYQRDYPAGYESGSSSSQLPDEMLLRSSEHDEIKLLKMVYELQDQLNKRCYVNEKPNQRDSSGVPTKEKYIPTDYSSELTEEEISQDLNYHSYPERRRQDWQRSAPLPPSIHSHNKRFHWFHPGHSYYSSYRSCPSSPQQFTDSKFSKWGRETKSDDQRHEDLRMKKSMREKHHPVRRHLRPTVGGAPFLICYACSKPLQLPADFLMFKRRFHLLRCGACSEVLKFSLENRTHIACYTPNAEAPPPREIDGYCEAINRRNSAASFYSTYRDPVIPTPSYSLQGSTDARDITAGSSESMEERKNLVLKQSRNKYKNPVETYKPAGPSSSKSASGKKSSEIEELPTRTGSPLHRLMGYSSASRVIRGSVLSSSGTSSFYMQTVVGE